jgi:hypothetical protein
MRDISLGLQKYCQVILLSSKVNKVGEALPVCNKKIIWTYKYFLWTFPTGDLIIFELIRSFKSAMME